MAEKPFGVRYITLGSYARSDQGGGEWPGGWSQSQNGVCALSPDGEVFGPFHLDAPSEAPDLQGPP